MKLVIEKHRKQIRKHNINLRDRKRLHYHFELEVSLGINKAVLHIREQLDVLECFV